MATIKLQALILLCAVSAAVADYSLTLDLQTISNSDGHLATGAHCSTFWWLGRECSLYISICVVSNAQYQPGAGSCVTGWVNLGAITDNNNVAVFSDGMTYGQFRNPTTFSFRGSWNGAIIKYNILSGSSSGSLIDYYEFSMNPSSTLGSNVGVIKDHPRSGVDPVKYQFRYIVSCLSGTINNLCMTPQSTTGAPTAPPSGAALAAQYLKSSIDTTKNPCTNFYQFACGNRIKQLTAGQTSVTVPQYQIFNKVAQLLTNVNPNDTSKPSAIHKAATLFTKCTTNVNFDMQLLKYIHTLDTWPIINPNWTTTCRLPYCAAESYDFMSQIGLMQTHHELPTLLSAQVMPDWRGSNNTGNGNNSNLVYLSPGTLYYGAPDYYTNPTLSASVLGNYKETIKYFARRFGRLSGLSSSDMTNLDTDAANIINLETKVAQFYTLPNLKRNMTTKYHRMTKGQLMSRWKNLNWEFYFLHLIPFNQLTQVANLSVWMPAQQTHHFFPKAFVWNNTNTVIVQDTDYFDSLNNLAATTSPRDQQNYVIWRFFVSRLFFLGEKTINEVKTLLGEHLPPNFPLFLGGNDLNLCSYLTMQSMPYATSRLYGDATAMSGDSAFNTIKSAIHNSFSNLIRSSLWLDINSKNTASIKLSNSVDLGRYPNQLHSDALINTLTMGLDIWKNDSFLIAYEKALTNKHLTLYQTLLLPAKSHMDWHMDYSIAEMAVTTRYARNEFQVSQALHKLPMYDPTFPMAVNMASLGTVYAFGQSQLFNDIGLQFGSTGKLGNWLSSSSFNNLMNRYNCFIDQYGQICPQNQAINTCVNGNAALGQTIATSAALNTARNAYKSWVQQNGVESRLPGLDQYSIDQIFYMSYMQTFCVNYNPGQLLASVLTGNVPVDQLSRNSLYETNDFAQTFNCPISNPSDQCKIW